MAKIEDLETSISSGYNANTQLNDNFTKIETAFENTLSLDGSTPNAMQANIDINSYRIINYPTTPSGDTDLITKGYADSQYGGTAVTLAQAAQAAAEAAQADAETAQTAAEAAQAIAEDWATETTGQVQATDYSAKEYAQGSQAGTGGSSKSWAITTGSLVDSVDYSAKEWSIGTTTTSGSSKDWAVKTDAQVQSVDYSSKFYAQDTTVSNEAGSGGSSKQWAIDTSGDITSGSSKAWAITAEDSLVDGSEYSAKHYAAKAQAAAASISFETIPPTVDNTIIRWDNGDSEYKYLEVTEDTLVGRRTGNDVEAISVADTRTLLGLGSAALVNTGTGSTEVPTNANLGTAAYVDLGTDPGDAVEVQTGNRLPALDGSLLTNLPLSGTIPSFLQGLEVSNNSTDSEHDLDIAAGKCSNSDNDDMITLLTAITKQIDANWAVGDNAGGFPSGTSLITTTTLTGTYATSGTTVTGSGTAFDTEFELGELIWSDTEGEFRKIMDIASATSMTIDAAFDTDVTAGETVKSADNTIHVFVIKNPTTGDVDAGFDKVATATNLLADATGYTDLRRIASLTLDNNNNLVSFTQKPGRRFYLNTIATDRSVTADGTGSWTSLALSTPPDVRALINITIDGRNSNVGGACDTRIKPTFMSAEQYRSYLRLDGDIGTSVQDGNGDNLSVEMEIDSDKYMDFYETYSGSGGANRNYYTLGWIDEAEV